MREIKFRVWRKSWSMMAQPEWITKYLNDERGICGIVFDNPCTDGHTERESWDDVADDLVLMQFTGLKDSEGRDIWEGDIIGMSPKWRYEVIWSPEKARWALRSTFAVARAHGKRAAKVFQALTNATKRKVIGNIYENPELLTV